MKIKPAAGFLVSIILLSLVHSPASAQSRIGFIDATKILKQMPESMDAESHLNQFIAQWNKEVNDMLADLTRKQNDYERKKLIMSDAERSAAEFDIADIKKRIEQYRQNKYGPNGELASQQESLITSPHARIYRR